MEHQGRSDQELPNTANENKDKGHEESQADHTADTLGQPSKAPYTPLEIEWLVDYVTSLPVLKINWETTTKLFYGRFGSMRTARGLYTKYSLVKKGLESRQEKRPDLRRSTFSPEQDDWLLAEIPRIKVMGNRGHIFRWDQAAEMFNRIFQQDYSGYQLRGRFKKLHALRAATLKEQ